MRKRWRKWIGKENNPFHNPISIYAMKDGELNADQLSLFLKHAKRNYVHVLNENAEHPLSAKNAEIYLPSRICQAIS